MAENNQRDEYKKRLERAKERAQANDLFSILDGGALESNKTPAPVRSSEDISKAIAILTDKTQPERKRLLALEAASLEFGSNADLFEAGLTILKDTDDTNSVRQVVIRLVKQASFHSTVYPERNPDVLGVLRTIVDNSEDAQPIRQSAAKILASIHDEMVQNRLFEGLENPDKAFVEPEIALRFLGYDVHAAKSEKLIEIVNNPPDIETKRVAVRLLATDSDNRDLLVSLLENKDEDQEVRQTCAISLRLADPSLFLDKAENIVLDESEDEDLRAIVLNGYARSQVKPRGIFESVSSGNEFAGKVKDLKSKAKGSLLKAINKYLDKN